MTPEGWAAVRVDEVFEIQLGKMLNKAAAEATPAFPYLGNREVQWGRIDFSDLRRMHFSEDERRKFALRKGDLLVCEGGEVGRAALWRYDTECYFQKALHRLRPLNARAMPEYMLQFLRFAAGRGLLSDFTSQSSIAHLTREKLAQVPVALPPLPEQRKIAAILSSVDGAIEATQAVIDQLGVVKQAMMAELLTRGLPGRYTRFKQTEIGKAPASWPTLRLRDLVERVTDGTHQSPEFTESGVPFLLVKSISSGRLNWKQTRFVSKETYSNLTRHWRPKQGDVLYSAVGATYGVAVVVDQDRDFCFQRHIAHLRPKHSIVRPGFLRDFLNGPAGRRQSDLAAVGNAQPTVTLRALGDFFVHVPPLDEQSRIEAVIGSIGARTHEEESVLSGLRRAKDSLATVLLTGELRVTPDEAP